MIDSFIGNVISFFPILMLFLVFIVPGIVLGIIFLSKRENKD